MIDLSRVRRWNNNQQGVESLQGDEDRRWRDGGLGRDYGDHRPWQSKVSYMLRGSFTVKSPTTVAHQHA